MKIEDIMEEDYFIRPYWEPCDSGLHARNFVELSCDDEDCLELEESGSKERLGY